MAILVELTSSGSVVFRDRTNVIWRDRSSVVFRDREDTTGTFNLSMDGQALNDYWDGVILSFSPPQFEMATRYGGFFDLRFGNIDISPQVFINNWPPPKRLQVIIKYVAEGDLESEAVLLFTGSVYLSSYSQTSTKYRIDPEPYTTNLLDDVVDYDGNTVPKPRAFGAVIHREPLRLPDDGSSRPTYDLAGVGTGSVAYAIESFTSASSGTKTKVTCISNHSFSNGNSVTINGTTNFNGSHTIESASGDNFVIPVAFPTDNSENLPIHANAFISGGFAVYDDGVPIQANVIDNGDGTFSLTEVPVGTVTISGTASQTDLEDVMTWCQSRLGIGSIDVTGQRGTSPAVSCWIDTQQTTIDFMSEITEFFTHYFYISADILYLCDVLLDNGTRTLDESEYGNEVRYGSIPPVNYVKAEWYTYEAVEGRLDNEVDSAVYVKEIQNKVIESQYSISTGTADGTGSNQLIDSGATFSSDGIKAGHMARNVDTGSEARVESVSETTLNLDSNIFTSGQEYVVGPSNNAGTEIELTPYHTVKSNVVAAIQNILQVMNRDEIEISIPIDGGLPLPGEKVTISDDRMIADTSAWFRVRGLTYDFENYKVVLSGEGVVS